MFLHYSATLQSSRYEAVNIPSVARQPIAPKRTPPLIEVLISHWLTLIRPAIKPLFLQGGGMLGGGRWTSQGLASHVYIAAGFQRQPSLPHEK